MPWLRLLEIDLMFFVMKKLKLKRVDRPRIVAQGGGDRVAGIFWDRARSDRSTPQDGRCSHLEIVRVEKSGRLKCTSACIGNADRV